VDSAVPDLNELFKIGPKAGSGDVISGESAVERANLVVTEVVTRNEVIDRTFEVNKPFFLIQTYKCLFDEDLTRHLGRDDGNLVVTVRGKPARGIQEFSVVRELVKEE
jgi:hypothetical protein